MVEPPVAFVSNASNAGLFRQRLGICCECIVFRRVSDAIKVMSSKCTLENVLTPW
jgi:hypothetical protein